MRTSEYFQAHKAFIESLNGQENIKIQGANDKREVEAIYGKWFYCNEQSP